MRRGPKPKPTVLHQLHGTLEPSRHKSRLTEPKPIGDLQAEPPEWLTPTQQDAWRYAIEHAPKSVLKRIDSGVLAIWCEAEDRHRVATIMQAKIDTSSKFPLLIKLKDGPLVVSPYLGIIDKAALVMMRAASEMGFSPTSRPRLSGTGENVDGAGTWAGLRVVK